MKDRVPVNPGRVLITPEDGSAPFYAVMTRADNPTQNGDPFSKATFLKDATAALFGLGNDALPDDVFCVLSRFQKGLGNEYVWHRHKVEVTDSFTYGSSKTTSLYYTNQIYYSDSIEFDGSKVVLVNPQTAQLSSVKNSMVGKYWYYGSMSVSIWDSVSGSSDYTITYREVTGTRTITDVDGGYFNSSNPNEYPDIDDEGFTYDFLGQIGGAAHIATGSYTGTGTYGSSNPNSLTFDFAPKLLFISRVGYNTAYFGILGMESGIAAIGVNFSGQGYVQGISVTVSGNTLSWYNGTSAACQLNEAAEYNYTVIG